MDDTKFSTDDSDGGIGGRTENSVTICDTTRAGTGTNRSNLSSTLMCVSNAADKPLPVYAMFSSDAQEENYSIDYRWIADFPRVQGVFGHEDVHEYWTQLTLNEKCGSDCRVLNQCLTGYQERLYPDAADIPGKRLLYTIDGGPGRLDEGYLAEKRALVIYLFPGVQNTTQLHQDMDQNYGQFKSDVLWNIATLTADLVREFSRQHSRNDEDPANCAAPTNTVSIGLDQYGLILSGRDAKEERRLSALLPAFNNAFYKSNNLSACANVGAVPCTHKSARNEVARDNNAIVIECFNLFLSLDYNTATMLEVQQQNKLACAHLNELDFNGDGFLIKA
jgi:hypothetical protein